MGDILGTLGRLASTHHRAYGARLSSALQKLSSGDKFSQINQRNSAHLGISQRFRAQIRALDQSSRVIQKVAQTLSAADSYAQHGQSLLGRMSQIAVRAADAGTSQTQREDLSAEFQQLKQEMALLNERAVVDEKQVGSASSVLLWNSETEKLTYTQHDGTQRAQLHQGLGGTHCDSHGIACAFEGTAITGGAGANSAPTANDNGSYVLYKDQTLTRTAAQGVLSDDLDVDNDSLTVSLVSDVSNGSLTLNADGSFTYTPTASYTGVDSFTYQVSDGTTLSTVATVNISVVDPAIPVAVGAEFMVNTETTDDQFLNEDGNNQSVAMDATGNFAVVWASTGQDGGGRGIFAQRYDLDGNAQGAEFQVNTYTSGNQETPAIAMDDDGDFVVVWRSNNQDGSQGGVYFQRYNSAGVAQGAETLANTTTSSDQHEPTVSMDSAGNFVIAWSSKGQDGSQDGVYAQRFSAAGAKVGGEFLVNTETSRDQKEAAVEMNGAGEFVIAWSSSGNSDGSQDGVFMQRYDAAGATVGGEVQVNTTTLKNQERPDVAISPTGETVVVWQSKNQDGDSWGVYGQIYDAAGAAVGGEFLVNQTTGSAQQQVDVSMDANGNFMVTWTGEGGQDGGGNGVFMRTYDINGTALTNETQVNTTSSGDQHYSGSAMGPNGRAVVVWHGNGTGDTDGIFAQRYALNQTPLAVDDVYHVDMTTVLTVGAGSGTNVNDFEPDGEAITASLVSTTSNGALTFNADGSFTYTPTAAWTGTDTFTYKINDGAQDSANATVSIVVTDPGAGATSETTAVGDYIVTRDGTQLLYIAQATNAADGVTAQQTLMNLSLTDQSIRTVDLLNAGSQNVNTGSGDRSRLSMDDQGRIWVGAKFSTTVGSDYYVPALLDTQAMSLDYGWTAATSEFNGGTSSAPVVKMHKDWVDFAVHRDRFYYVEHNTQEIISQGLHDANDKKSLIDLDVFSSTELSDTGLAWSGSQKFHGFSTDGQYAVFETAQSSGSNNTVLVVLNTLTTEWDHYDTGGGAGSIGSVSFDRNNNLYWTDLTSNSVNRARIGIGKEPKIHDITRIRQLENNAQVGVGASALSVMGTGLSADGGAVFSNTELQLSHGETLTVSTNKHSTHLVDLGISQANVDSVENAKEAVESLQNALNIISGYRADIGKASSQLSVSLNSARTAYSQLSQAEGSLSSVDTAANMAEVAQMQIRQNSAITSLMQSRALRDFVIGRFLDRAIG